MYVYGKSSNHIFPQNEGIDFVIEGVTYNFRGSLALIPADNLASQFIGGYKALNAALRKCRHCMATGDSMRCKVCALCVYKNRRCYTSLLSFWLVTFKHEVDQLIWSIVQCFKVNVPTMLQQHTASHATPS